MGHDFAPYRARLAELGIDDTYVTELPETYTAQAFITTDMDDNQIIAFHPGAMSHAHRNHVRDVEGVEFGIVAPDGRDAMLQHATEFAERGTPFIFDPGQGLPMFDGADLDGFIDKAEWVVVNDYESRVLCEKTGLAIEDIARRVSALVVTLGARGAEVHTGGQTIDIEPVKASRAVDPTGCGDAFRGGLLYGLAAGLDWPTCGRIASLMGSIKIEHHGTQNHRVTMDEIDGRFREAFGYSFR